MGISREDNKKAEYDALIEAEKAEEDAAAEEESKYLAAEAAREGENQMRGYQQ